MTGSTVPQGATLGAVDRAVVYRREPAPTGVDEVRRETVERLHDLRDREHLESVSTEVWDETGSVENGDRPSVPELLRSFETWARGHDRSLHPAFRRVIAESADGERQETLEPPLLCLALYGADALAAVYPHCDGSVVHTVQDGLDALTTTVSTAESVA